MKKTLYQYLEGIRIAWRSLKAHRLRTVLTMLGVSIGIFAITIIFTLVNSLNYNLTRNLNRLGSSVLYVYHLPWTSESFESWQKFVTRPRVSYNEYLRLKKNLDHVEGVAFEARGTSTNLKYNSNLVTGAITKCITQDFVDINDLELASGRPFTPLETDAGRPVCLIGASIAENLFGDFSPIGRHIQVKGKKARVVGVLKKSGMNTFGNNPDETLYLPYGFGARVFDLTNRRRDRYIIVKTKSTREIDLVENQIIGLMRSARGLRPRAENDFAINRPEMLLNTFGNVTKYLWIGGLFISFFAVVVGGFGIGNIMFTTVKERTFEIGLQKALGAKSNFILFQFLMEAVLLCLLGGLLGLLLNFGITKLVQAVVDSMEIDFQMVVSTGSIVFGILLSVFIGLASGLIPSFIAARMDPVESMRQ